MRRSSAALIAALCVVVLAGQAHALRDLREPGTTFAARALKQVGDAFTRWGQGGYVDDGSRSYGTMYSAIVSSGGFRARGEAHGGVACAGRRLSSTTTHLGVVWAAPVPSWRLPVLCMR